MPTMRDFDLGEIYSAYAAGTLDAGFRLLVETQAALRPDVKRAVAKSESLAGALLELEEPAVLAKDAFSHLLAIIDAAPTPVKTVPQAMAATEMSDTSELGRLPAPLSGIALNAERDAGWSRLFPGVKRLKIELGSNREVDLYRIEPGRKIPRHSHKGSEFTLVVAGGFTDETGSFGPGDLSIKGPNDTHRPVGDEGEVCFALAVYEDGLRFKGWLGLAQRLTGN